MIVVLLFAIAPVAIAGALQGVGAAAFGWRGAKWVGVLTGLLAMGILAQHYSVPPENVNDRTGQGMVLVTGCWIALIESTIVFLSGVGRAPNLKESERE